MWHSFDPVGACALEEEKRDRGNEVLKMVIQMHTEKQGCLKEDRGYKRESISHPRR